jgi:acyl-CoA synthetase (AMP-forming)/AMP-acid ligase II
VAGSTTTELADRIAAVAGLDPGAPVIEFEGQWATWGDLGVTMGSVAAAVPRPGAPVGVLLRNRPEHVALVLGVLQAGGCVVTIDPGRGVERTRAEVSALDLPMLGGTADDVRAVIGDGGRPTTLVAATGLGAPVTVTPGDGSGGHPDRPGVAVRMLTSGTTGPPTRVDLTYQTFERVLAGAKHYEADTRPTLRLRSGVAVVHAPLVHLSGLFRVLQCIADGRSFALLERFGVAPWVDAVRRHRPATVSLVPTALRMVLDADVDPDALSSVRSVVSGTAPLSPDDADAFTARYGIPVLISYAATEFGGGVAGWNLADHTRFWAEKRGSVGRAHEGCELRVVDPDDGRVLGADAVGLLEVRASQLGDDGTWLRTTDLARLDADGFLWIVGRADQAILRGGFKVHPDTVRAVLEAHPSVRGAAVVGIPHPRLGAVPVAAVELRPGAATTAADLTAHARAGLSRYEIPVEIRVVEALPRTPSGKAELGAVRALFPSVVEEG